MENTSSKKPSILAVGGAGYVGSVFVREALAAGYAVTVIDNLLYDNLISLSDVYDHPDFSFIKGDFCDKETITRALAGINHVVLLAALVGDPISKKYPDAARKINEEGATSLFDLAGRFSVERFVFLSTCSNYGLRADDSYATEEASLNPQSLYATCKVAVERYLLDQQGKSNLSATILRLATAYGMSARMRFDLSIAEFTRSLALGENLLIYDENTWRPYCHIRDISRAVLSVLKAPKSDVAGEVFNVGSTEQNLTKKQIVELIRRHTDRGTFSYKSGGTDPRNYRVSFDKIAQKLKFKPLHTVEGSVKSLISALENGAFMDYSSRRSFYGNYVIPLFENAPKISSPAVPQDVLQRG